MSLRSEHKLSTDNGSPACSDRVPSQGGDASQPELQLRNPWLSFAICLFLALAVWIVFGQTLHHQFVNYDDDSRVYENSAVARGFTFEGIATVFSFKHSSPDYWHPLTFLTHMLDCQLYGLNAAGHHLTNVLLHAAVAVLLFLTLRQMTAAFWRSAFVAAVFAIHPLRVESVAWISERKDMLSGVFFLLTIAAYLRYGRARWSLGRYLAVVVLFALGLMSKPTLMPLPFLLLVLDYWPLGRFGAAAQPGRAPRMEGPPILRRLPVFWGLIVEKLPLLALSVGSCIEAALGNAPAFRSQTGIPLALRFENVVVSYAAYLWQTIWPVRLAVLYPFPRLGLPAWQVLLAAGVLAGISVGVFLWRKRIPFALVGWLWYLGMLVPMIGIVPAGSQAWADRYTYLPMIGVYLMVTWAVADAAAFWRVRRWTLGVAAVGLITILMVRSSAQTSYWRNSESLWTHTLACTERNSIAHNGLGYTFWQQGRTEEAIAQYREALSLNPAYEDAHSNLGNAMLQHGRVEDAILEYREALRTDPAHVEAHSNLGNALLQQGQTEEAIAQIREALRINPAYAAAHNNLGNAFFQQERMEEATAQFREALKVNPAFAEAHNNLGNALLFGQGQTEEAIAQYREALKINPAHVNAHLNLGNVLFQQGRADEAIVHTQKALELQPASVAIQNNLAWMLATAPQASLRNGARAVQLASEASRSSGGKDPLNLHILAAACAEAGDFPNAVRTAQHALQLAEAQSKTDLAAKLRREIRLYEAGQTFRGSP